MFIVNLEFMSLQFNTKNRNPFQAIVGVAVVVFIFIALYFVTKGVFKILSLIAPVLLIITLILDYKVILNYGQWLIKLAKKNILMGIGAIVLTVIGFPFVAAYLFGKALLKRKVKQVQKQYQQQTQGELVEYEEVDEEPKDILELPQIVDRPQKEKRNQYDNLFDEEALK